MCIRDRVNNANLSRVAEVNQLSRQIEEHAFTLQEAREELNRIENMPGFPAKLQIASAGIAGALSLIHI